MTKAEYHDRLREQARKEYGKRVAASVGGGVMDATAILGRLVAIMDRDGIRTPKDHACADCRGSMIVPGFKCAWHEAVDCVRSEEA